MVPPLPLGLPRKFQASEQRKLLECRAKWPPGPTRAHPPSEQEGPAPRRDARRAWGARRRPPPQRTRVQVFTSPDACSSSLGWLAARPPGPTPRGGVRACDPGSRVVTTSSCVFLHVDPHTTRPARCRRPSLQCASQVSTEGGPSRGLQPLALAAGQGASAPPSKEPDVRCPQRLPRALGPQHELSSATLHLGGGPQKTQAGALP